MGAAKLEWLDFNCRVFKPLLPIRMRLQKITQQILQKAQPPTGKKMVVRCENDEANRRYKAFINKNEVTKKHIRKYRVRYWAVNQIEDMNLEDENQDIVGELIDNTGVAGSAIVQSQAEIDVQDLEAEEKKLESNVDGMGDNMDLDK